MRRRLKEIDLYGNYIKWTKEAAIFKCFIRSTVFVSLKHYPDFELYDVSSASDDIADKIIKLIAAYDAAKTLFIIDIPGSKAVNAAYFLQENIGIKAIPVFNGILHEFGLVGDREFISRLLRFGELLSIKPMNGFAFILDSLRYGDYSDDELKENFNNQYELNEDDLPSAEFLKEAGYESILFISEGGIREDMEGYLSYLSECDMKILKAGL